MKKKVAIIGAGLAGLNCARHLENNKNIHIDIFEKTDRIGGRIKTDKVDGFLLDHGFQVFLGRYPEAKNSFDYKNLELYPFIPGAMINHEYIGDPLRNISDLFPTLLSNIGSLKDKLLILKLRYDNINSSKNLSTIQFLKNYGFSNKIIEDFFIPFFSGIFLNKSLSNDSQFFQFLFKLFSNDNATLPKNGMQDLPLNLANQLNKTKINLKSNVEIISKNEIEINNERKRYDFIVKAFPPASTKFHSIFTDYFWTNNNNKQKPVLHLFTKKRSNLINHIAPVSLANKNYAPKGKVLYSINFFNEQPIELIKKELEKLFPNNQFFHIRRYHIKEALPVIGDKAKPENISDFLIAGDYLETPSINGALVSGRKAASAITTKI